MNNNMMPTVFLNKLCINISDAVSLTLGLSNII